MRVVKFGNKWIDLDHVLAVEKHPILRGVSVAYIRVIMAFRNDHVEIAVPFPKYPLSLHADPVLKSLELKAAREYEEKQAEQVRDEFIKLRTNKP